tara:strand:+ start:19 stop:579 length:561 start_codon:yes stop_codon:yes gene_type:complete
MAEKEKSKTNIPEVLICNPQDGTLRIGCETKAVKRPSQAQLMAGSGANLRLYKDGGWELRATANGPGSNLIQQGSGPLNIKSEGDVNIDCDGRFSVAAKEIVMKATDASEGDIVLQPAHNFRADVGNYAIIMATQVTLDAKDKILSHSQGMNYIIGANVRIHEPVSQLVPASFKTSIETLTDTLKA